MTAAFSSLRTLTLPLAAAVLLALVPSAYASRPAVNDELRAADAPRTELSLDQTIAVPNGELYRYSQQVGGVEVLGAEAVLVDPATARPSLVTDTTSGGVPARG
ncbi:MAG TPA: hypothetical protein VKB00_05845, partial [Candidatus Limnocylindrales bacterium]|nr:hypothetical protein [Candidatus Limnocylindrales bacterium]